MGILSRSLKRLRELGSAIEDAAPSLVDAAKGGLRLTTAIHGGAPSVYGTYNPLQIAGGMWRDYERQYQGAIREPASFLVNEALTGQGGSPFSGQEYRRLQQHSAAIDNPLLRYGAQGGTLALDVLSNPLTYVGSPAVKLPGIASPVLRKTTETVIEQAPGLAGVGGFGGKTAASRAIRALALGTVSGAGAAAGADVAEAAGVNPLIGSLAGGLLAPVAADLGAAAARPALRDARTEIARPGLAMGVAPTPENIRLYHGTGSAFDRPDAAKFDPNGLFGPGYYLTSDPRVAGSYGDARDEYAKMLRPEIEATRDYTQRLERDLQGVPKDDARWGHLERERGRLARLESELPDSGPNIRPVDVPRGLRLFDVDKPISGSEMRRVRAAITDPRLLHEYDVTFARRDYSDAGWRGEDVYYALGQALSRTGSETPLAEVNRIIGGLGYDGIRYDGGKRIPLKDEGGKDITHDAYVIFPESLDKIRNALSGTPGGLLPASPGYQRPASATGSPLARDLTGAFGGGATGVAVSEVGAPEDESAGEAWRRRLTAGAFGAAGGIGALRAARGSGTPGALRSSSAALVPEDVARTLTVSEPTALERTLWRRLADANSDTVTLERDGVRIELNRFQKPEQALRPTPRGIYYSAGKAADSPYRPVDETAGSISYYGGNQIIEGDTFFKRPLIVTDDPGGPKTSAELLGRTFPHQLRDAAQRLFETDDDRDARRIIREIRDLVRSAGGDPKDVTWALDNTSQTAQTLYHAINEATIVRVARNAGYDGWILMRPETGEIAEVVDLRESHYPGLQGEFRINRQFQKTVAPTPAQLERIRRSRLSVRVPLATAEFMAHMKLREARQALDFWTDVAEGRRPQPVIRGSGNEVEYYRGRVATAQAAYEDANRALREFDEGTARMLGELGTPQPPPGLGIVPPDVARRLPGEVRIPDDPAVRRTIENTPGARITDDGVELDVARWQKPNLPGVTAARGGVWYAPEFDDTYKSANPFSEAGGNVGIQGRTVFRRPLVVNSPFVEFALRHFFDEEQLKIFRRQSELIAAEADAVQMFPTAARKEELRGRVEEFLSRWGADPAAAGPLTDALTTIEAPDYLKATLINDRVAADYVRAQGYDGIIAAPTGLQINEIADLREAAYPGPGGEFTLRPEFAFDFDSWVARNRDNPEAIRAAARALDRAAHAGPSARQAFELDRKGLLRDVFGVDTLPRGAKAWTDFLLTPGAVQGAAGRVLYGIVVEGETDPDAIARNAAEGALIGVGARRVGVAARQLPLGVVDPKRTRAMLEGGRGKGDAPKASGQRSEIRVTRIETRPDLFQARDVEPGKSYNEARVQALMRRIEAEGFDPEQGRITVVRDPDAPGRFIVVGGHHRLEAARRLGLEKLPALIAPENIARPEELAQARVRAATDNFRTVANTVRDRVNVVQALKTAGLDDAEIARRTAMRPAEVERLADIALLGEGALARLTAEPGLEALAAEVGRGVRVYRVDPAEATQLFTRAASPDQGGRVPSPAAMRQTIDRFGKALAEAPLQADFFGAIGETGGTRGGLLALIDDYSRAVAEIERAQATLRQQRRAVEALAGEDAQDAVQALTARADARLAELQARRQALDDDINRALREGQQQAAPQMRLGEAAAAAAEPSAAAAGPLPGQIGMFGEPPSGPPRPPVAEGAPEPGPGGDLPRTTPIVGEGQPLPPPKRAREGQQQAFPGLSPAGERRSLFQLGKFILDTAREFMLSGDISQVGRIGFEAQIHGLAAGRPGRTAAGFARALKAAFDPKYAEEYIRNDRWRGIAYPDTATRNPEFTGITDRIPVLGALNRAMFQRFTPVMAAETAEAMYQGMRQAGDFATLLDAEAREQIGGWVRQALIGKELSAVDASQVQRAVANFTFLSPRWTLGKLRQAGAVADPGPQGELARRFWATALFTGLTMSVGITAAVTGKHPRDLLDPTHPDSVVDPRRGSRFLSIELPNGTTVSPFQAFIAPFRFLLRPLVEGGEELAATGDLLAAVQAVVGEGKDSATQYLLGRTAPPVRLFNDVIVRNETFDGRPIVTAPGLFGALQALRYAGEQVAPIGVQPYLDRTPRPEGTEPNLVDRLVETGSGFLGVQARPPGRLPDDVQRALAGELRRRGAAVPRSEADLYRAFQALNLDADEQAAFARAHPEVGRYLEEKRQTRGGGDTIAVYRREKSTLDTARRTALVELEKEGLPGDEYRRRRSEIMTRYRERLGWTQERLFGTSDPAKVEARLTEVYRSDREAGPVRKALDGLYAIRQEGEGADARDAYFQARREYLAALPAEIRAKIEQKQLDDAPTETERRYVQWQRLMDERARIPERVGMSNEESRAAGTVISRARARQQARPGLPLEAAIMLDGRASAAEKRNALRIVNGFAPTSPARRRWMIDHPLVLAFDSSLTLDELDALVA